jgi:hypothetical protein
MTAKSYAICFAPNIVDTDSVTDTMQATLMCDIAIDFIETWDTHEICPMKLDLLQ